MIAVAALKFVCIEEPHWRSTVVPATETGQPAVSGTLRPMFQRLLVHLRDAAPLDVLDRGRVDAVALDEGVDDLRGELVAANRGEGAVLAPDRAADGVDDQRVGHASSLRADVCSRDAGEPQLCDRTRNRTRGPRP